MSAPDTFGATFGTEVMLRDDEVDAVVEVLQTHFHDRLSEWETGFVQSVGEQRDAGRDLTDKQKAKLDEVFERAANHGKG